MNVTELPSQHRIAVVGAAGVGKSCFINQYIHEKFSEEAVDPATTVDRKVLDYDGLHTISFEEVSTPADGTLDEDVMETLRRIIENYTLWIFMFVQNDRQSKDFLQTWLERLTMMAEEYPDRIYSAILCSNKCDGDGYQVYKPKGRLDHLYQSFIGFRNANNHRACSIVNISNMRDDLVIHTVDQCIQGYMKEYESLAQHLRTEEFKETVDKSVLLDCCMSGGATMMYDLVTIIVSLADITTDIWVLRQWHSEGRMTPFAISLTILIIAQLSYSVAFLIRFCDSTFVFGKLKGKYDKSIWPVIICLIPLSPFLSVIMYLASDPSNCVAQWMHGYGFVIEDYTPSNNATKIEHFVQSKLIKHLGFLIESIVEAFPQSILQMVVMVYYSETNWVSVVSILLSLLSVCTKSLVFSYALEVRTFVFNYLSIVLDFVSVFALITWLLYNPDGNSGGSITTLASWWILKFYVVTLPIVAIALFLLSSYFAIDYAQGRLDYRPDCEDIMRSICMFPCYWTLALMVAPFAVLLCELSCCSALALAMYGCFSQRFESVAATGIFWGHVFSFIYEGDGWEDKKLRVILVTESVFNGESSMDNRLYRYISQGRQNLYADIDFRGLRSESNRENSNPMVAWMNFQREIFQGMYEEKCQFFVENDHFSKDICCIFTGNLIGTYLVFPAYVLGRVFNFVYIWIALMTTPWSRIDALQLGMAALVIGLQMMWAVSLCVVIKFNYLTYHIFPGHRRVGLIIRTDKKAYEKLQRITDLHSAYTCEPLRKQMVIERFGQDVGSVVLLYTPTLIHDLGNTTY